MMLRLYNTLTRRKEAFVPREPGRVGLYVCGPTVYDDSHIGHARAYVAFDVVVRALGFLGYEVKHVRNFTDIDDKIIARARERGEEPAALAERYIASYLEDMDALGNLRPHVAPRVTGHLDAILDLVTRLVDRGHAYEVEGDVYFAVDSFAGYGMLSGRNLEQMQAGARVEIDPRKRNPMDFALWKAARPDEPSWESPWGPGRPGWHIECSAMSRVHLGDTFDLHGGGKDLVFPHHENEIAQSQGALGPGTFARVWLHNGFVNVDQEKMSKSLGNFFTIKQVLAQHHPEALRHALLATHYRSPISFSQELLAEAARRLDYCYESLARWDEVVAGHPTDPGSGGAGVDSTPREALREALADDFNTPRALAVTAEWFRAGNELCDRATPADRSALAGLRQTVALASEALGLWGRDPETYLLERRRQAAGSSGVEPDVVERLVAERTAARAARDFARADAIRDELAALGVELRDGPEGTTWRLRAP